MADPFLRDYMGEVWVGWCYRCNEMLVECPRRDEFAASSHLRPCYGCGDKYVIWLAGMHEYARSRMYGPLVRAAGFRAGTALQSVNKLAVAMRACVAERDPEELEALGLLFNADPVSAAELVEAGARVLVTTGVAAPR